MPTEKNLDIILESELEFKPYSPEFDTFKKEPVTFLLVNALRHLTQDQQRQLCSALLERLPVPVSITDEAERLYPYCVMDEKLTEGLPTIRVHIGQYNESVDRVRSAHITAARQYMGEIDKARKEAKIELLWELIEEWQDARDNGEDIHAPKFSFNDIEVDLYEWLEKIDPAGRKEKRK